jgi:transcriptional regulator with XRE-family HTH domain
MPTCFEFRAGLEAASFSASEFAALLKVERSTAWRWFKGEREVPHYAMVALSALAGLNATALRAGGILKPKVERRHVYLAGETFKDLAKRWHPDASGRDTTAEMQFVNLYRSRS